MHCKVKDCPGKLEVFRLCRKVQMRCTVCGRQYQIHEVAEHLDQETEEILARYTAIIYD